MAGQDLGLNIKTTSDVPQAMDKAKSATVSFAKQVEDIQKKFSTSFKDIFLSFLGPLALLSTAIAFIGKLIADNQRKHAEANQAAIDGTNKLMSAEDRYWSRKKELEKKDKETVEEAKTTREDVTRSFLRTDPRGKAILAREMKGKPFENVDSYPWALSRVKRVQEEIQAMIAEDVKKNPISGGKDATSFKGPEGYSNVVGVGPNPVVEAMNAQLDETKKTNAILERIASPGSIVPQDFTKPNQAAPSRSYLLKH